MKLTKLIGSCFGLGYSPMAPGTMGAIAGCIIWCVIKYFSQLPDELLLLFTIGLFVAGKLAADKLEKEWGHDPKQFVFDETVGMLVSLSFVPFQWDLLLAAFILFRFFDITKLLFIRRMERLPHGWGVMMDDVLAGAYSNLILMIFIWTR